MNELVDVLLKLIPIIISLVALSYTIYSNIKNRRTTEKLNRQVNILKADDRMISVNNARTEFEAMYTQLLTSNESGEGGCLENLFLNTYNKYVDWFNKINKYCSLVLIDEAIEAEDFIKKDIVGDFSKYAKIQYEVFDTLQRYALNHHLEPIRKPDFNSFKEYDTFLIKYNGGVDSAYWVDIKTHRRNVGFE